MNVLICCFTLDWQLTLLHRMPHAEYKAYPAVFSTEVNHARLGVPLCRVHGALGARRRLSRKLPLG